MFWLKYYEEPSIGGWHNLGMTDPCYKFPLAGGRRACTQRKDPLLAAMLDTRQGPRSSYGSYNGFVWA